jgi:peptidylprolyl isomerase
VSSNRRQQQREQQRRQRQTQRRQSRRNQETFTESVGLVKFTGPMGFMQRHTREFFVGGILVMVLSLGSIIFSTALGGATPHEAEPDATATPTAKATAEASATSSDPVDEIVRVYAAAPELEIEPEASYEAVLHLESGDVRIELYAAEATGYVNNFVFLARNRFFDGLTFHRVIPGFAAQSGDPTGAGFGSPGYVLADESNNLQFERGVLSMAEDSVGQVAGSQFFVTLGPTPHLNGDFTVFGRVVEGLELLDGLTARDPLKPDQPAGDTILSIEIIEDGA